MRKDDFLDAMGQIDDRYIDEAVNAGRRSYYRYVKYAGLAAAAALAVFVGLKFFRGPLSKTSEKAAGMDRNMIVTSTASMDNAVTGIATGGTEISSMETQNYSADGTFAPQDAEKGAEEAGGSGFTSRLSFSDGTTAVLTITQENEAEGSLKVTAELTDVIPEENLKNMKLVFEPAEAFSDTSEAEALICGTLKDFQADDARPEILLSYGEREEYRFSVNPE